MKHFCALFLALSCTMLQLWGQKAPAPKAINPTGQQGQAPKLVIPTGHTRIISKMRASPDGKLLASTSLDGTMKVWDTRTGDELHTYRPDSESAIDVAFSADGRHLAVTGYSNLRILETGSWRTVKEIDGAIMGSAIFDPIKSVLYYQIQEAISDDRATQHLFVYDLATQQSTKLKDIPLEALDKGIPGYLDIAPDGSRLLLAMNYKTPSRLIDVRSGELRLVEGAQRFLPNGDLFFLRETPKDTTYGIVTIDGTIKWQRKGKTPDKYFSFNRLTRTMDFDRATGMLYWRNRLGELASGHYAANDLKIEAAVEGLHEAVAVGPDQRLYLATMNPFQIKVFSLPQRKHIATFGETTIRPFVLAAAAAAPVVAWGGFGKIKVLEMKGNRVIVQPEPMVGFGPEVELSDNGQMIASNHWPTNEFNYLPTGANATQMKRFQLELEAPSQLFMSKDGGTLAAVSSKEILVMDTKTHTSTYRYENPDPNTSYSSGGALSPDGSKLLLSILPPGAVMIAQTTLVLHDLKQQKILYQSKVNCQQYRFSPDGQYVYGVTNTGIIKLDAATGQVIKSWTRPSGGRVPSARVNVECTRVAYCQNERAYVFDLTTGQEHAIVDDGSYEIQTQIAWLLNDFFAVGQLDGTVRIFDARTHKLAAMLIQYEREPDWAVLTPDGRFDGSAGALKKMYYLLDGRKVALEQLYEGFFTPGLLSQVLARTTTSEPPAVSITRAARPPTVRLDYSVGGRNLSVEDDVPATALRTIETTTAQATFTLTATAPGSTLAELRLYHNGKLLDAASARNLVVEDEPVPGGGGGGSNATGPKRRYTLTLLPGANDFRAVAINAERTESRPSELRVVYNAASAKTAPTGARLHLVTVGINVYKNPKYNLNYAEADAGGIERAITEGLKRIVSATKTYTIRNAGATRAEILAALAKVSAEAAPEDVFVFYYAGHGVMSAADFYIVPYDVTQLYGNEAGLASRGISASELKKIAAGIPAQKQLYILDACQSAGAVENIVSRGAAEEKAIAQLARSTGTHWLTASGSEQFANEFDAIGHGAFTFALLEALGGKAAGDDGRVSVNELKAYLDIAVPEITEKYLGQAQYPASYGYGQDFPVSVRP